MGDNFRQVVWMLFLAAILAGCALLPQPSPAPQPSTARPADLLIRIRLLKGDPAVRTLIGENMARMHGRESGPSIRSAARDGRIQPHPGRFRFSIELRNFNYEEMQGRTIRLSRVVDGKLQLQPVPISKDFGMPDAQGHPQYRVEVEVLDGEGQFEILTRWATADSFFAVRAPDEIGPLFRPHAPYRVLSSCTRQRVVSRQCGTYPDMGIGELLNIVRHDPDRVVNILFMTLVEK